MTHIDLNDDFNLIMTILVSELHVIKFRQCLITKRCIYNISSLYFKGGGIFVRWGRKDCPGINTELVYSGQYASNSFIFCYILKMT